jgi:Protein of unknown function (DUF4238)
MERRLAGLEGVYAELIKRTADISYRPGIDEQRFFARLISLQTKRTAEQVKHALINMREMYDFFQLSCKAHGIALEEPPPDTHSAMASVMSAFSYELREKILDDLKVVILRNESTRDFVTSDHPAVLTNRWQIQRLKRNSFGTNSAGLLLFMPLGPKTLVMAYDKRVYSISNDRGIATVRIESDVLAFNINQYIQAASSIYFRRTDEAGKIAQEIAKFKDFRPETWGEFHVAECTSETQDSKKYVVGTPVDIAKADDAFMHLQSLYPIPPMWPSMLKIRQDATGYTKGRQVVRQWIANKDILNRDQYRKVRK